MLIYFETDDLDTVKNETTIFKNRVITYNTPIREWIAQSDPHNTNVLYGTKVFDPSQRTEFAIDHLILAHNKGMMFSNNVKTTFKGRNQALTTRPDHVFPSYVSVIDGAMLKIPTAYDNIVSRAADIEKEGIEYLGPLLVTPRFILDYDGDPLDLFMDVIDHVPNDNAWRDIGVANAGTTNPDSLLDIFSSFTYPVHDGTVTSYSDYAFYDENDETIDGIPVPLFPEGTTMYEGKYINHLFKALESEGAQ